MAGDANRRMSIPKCQSVLSLLIVVDQGTLEDPNIGPDNRIDPVAARERPWQHQRRGGRSWGDRIRRSDGQPVMIDRTAQQRGAAANRARAVDRAADLAPTIAQIRSRGAKTLQAIADGLNDAGIQTPRGQGRWSPVQVKRTLDAL